MIASIEAQRVSNASRCCGIPLQQLIGLGFRCGRRRGGERVDLRPLHNSSAVPRVGDTSLRRAIRRPRTGSRSRAQRHRESRVTRTRPRATTRPARPRTRPAARPRPMGRKTPLVGSVRSEGEEASRTSLLVRTTKRGPPSTSRSSTSACALSAFPNHPLLRHAPSQYGRMRLVLVRRIFRGLNNARLLRAEQGQSRIRPWRTSHA